jgi:hypothetical protein
VHARQQVRPDQWEASGVSRQSRKRQGRQEGESLEHWLRRSAADPESGIPIDPRMTLELYDRIAALEARLSELEARQ